MANIFDALEVGKSVFKDKQPLDHRFLPENLPHRKEQITQIAKYWIEALNNVTKALSQRTTIPVLNGIVFDVNEKGMELLASDSELTIKVLIPNNDIDAILVI